MGAMPSRSGGSGMVVVDVDRAIPSLLESFKGWKIVLVTTNHKICTLPLPSLYYFLLLFTPFHIGLCCTAEVLSSLLVTFESGCQNTCIDVQSLSLKLLAVHRAPREAVADFVRLSRHVCTQDAAPDSTPKVLSCWQPVVPCSASSLRPSCSRANRL